MKMGMYDDGNTGIAMESGFIETHAGDLHVYKDRTQAGNIVFITTDNFKKYIPIEWIKEWYKTHVYYLKEEKPIIYAYEQMIMDWENENDKGSE